MGCRFRLMMMVVLAWGSLAFANLPPDVSADASGQEQELSSSAISSWIAYLNNNYPQVHVRTLVDTQDPQMRRALVGELDRLEKYLRGDSFVRPHDLSTIACGAVCGGGDDGKCHTCQMDDH